MPPPPSPIAVDYRIVKVGRCSWVVGGDDSFDSLFLGKIDGESGSLGVLLPLVVSFPRRGAMMNRKTDRIDVCFRSNFGWF